VAFKSLYSQMETKEILQAGGYGRMLFWVFWVKEIRGDGVGLVIQSCRSYDYSIEAISYWTDQRQPCLQSTLSDLSCFLALCSVTWGLTVAS